MLAFYTRDAAQIDRLFRGSGLPRPKWDERHAADGRTYGEMTIDKALSFVTETYAPPRRKVPHGYRVPQGSSNGRGATETRARGDAQPGRPRKVKLLTEDYIKLYQTWGYSARLNLCTDDVEVNGWPLRDVVESQIRARVRDYGTANNVSVNIQHCCEALVVMAAKDAYHPIKAYLEALRWDGQDHIAALAAHFIDQEGLFARWYRHWQVGAVAKVYEGFQNPVLVLDGPQDIGKSYFVAWLGSPLPHMFNASAICPDLKDHRLRLMQTFLWEVEELGATTRRADVEALKAFISLHMVRERKLYGRHDIIKPALASFIGTLNNEAGFLLDRTGNRRFLVCTLTAIDWGYAERVDVDQVWAQAAHLYHSGDDWRLSEADRRRRDVANEGYMVDDPIEEYIKDQFVYTGDRNDYVPLSYILDQLALHHIKADTATTMAVASVMLSLGAEKDRKRLKGKRPVVYYKMKPR